jgi:hypothetical protein
MSDVEWVPGSKAELMASIEREWKSLMDVVVRLDFTQMTTPDEGGWSPKDNLAHLTEWMNILMGYHMDRRPPHEVVGISEDAMIGVSEDVASAWDMGVINPILFERNRNRPLQDVLAELKSVYVKLINKLEVMPFEELLLPRHANEPEKRPVILWVLGNTTDHFAEHRATIEKML